MARSPSLAEGAAHRISLIRTGEGSGANWLAEVEGLPGCSARAATPEEAVQRAWGAAEEATNSRTTGAEEPKSKSASHSGKLLVRMPATLHDELARTAESEGVSLNQLITGVLASAVEWRSGDERHRNSRPRVAGVAVSDETLPARVTRLVLAANLVVVLVAAAVAIGLLIVAWRTGF